jgi:hypothetical protein
MPSTRPVRYPSGVSTDTPLGPLANYGLPNPFFYHHLEDDFDELITADGRWTVYNKAGGSVANVAGDGGRLLFTTAATSGDVESIQTTVAGFTLTAGKKSFFLTRLQMSSVAATGPTVIAGLIDQTATPNLTITDGIYFIINAGVAKLRVSTGSTNTDTVLPTTAYATQANSAATAMAAATDYDMGFYVDRNQNIAIFFAQQLVGWLPQSGTGVVYPTSGVTVAPNPGPCAMLSQTPTAVTLTAVGLAPTLVLSEGSGAAAVTMNADFVMTSKER